MNVYCKIYGKLAKFVVHTDYFIEAISVVDNEYKADGCIMAVVK